jgi:PhnB protein
MRLSTHLTFGGNCAEAFRFYERALGGTLETMMTWGESPLGATIPPEWRDKIVHATLTVGGATIAGADAQDHEPARGFFVLVSVADVAEAELVFAALSDGGDVRLPLQKTFWSPAFGVVVDRFGTPWEITT